MDTNLLSVYMSKMMFVFLSLSLSLSLKTTCRLKLGGQELWLLIRRYLNSLELQMWKFSFMHWFMIGDNPLHLCLPEDWVWDMNQLTDQMMSLNRLFLYERWRM